VSTLILSILSEQTPGLLNSKASRLGDSVENISSSSLSIDTLASAQSNSEFAKQFSLMRQQISQKNPLKGNILPPIQINLLEMVKKQASELGVVLNDNTEIELVNRTSLSDQELYQLLEQGLADNSVDLNSEEMQQLLTKLKQLLNLRNQQHGHEVKSKLDVQPKEIPSLDVMPRFDISNVNSRANESSIYIELAAKGEGATSKSQTLELILTNLVKEGAEIKKGTDASREVFSLENLTRKNRGSSEFPAGKLSLQESNSTIKDQLSPLLFSTNKEGGEKAHPMPPEEVNKRFFDKLQQIKMGDKISEEVSKATTRLQKGLKIDNALSQLGALSQYADNQPVSESRPLYSISHSPIAASDTASVQSANLTTQPNLQSGLSLRNDFSPNLAARIQWIYSQAMSSAEIKMDPAELGSMNVKLKTINGETSILFNVNNLQTKEMIEDNLSKLRDLLSDQGLNLGEAHVEHQSQKEKGDNPTTETNLAELEDNDEESNHSHTSVQEGILDTYI